jgi:hypothetical protein
VVRTSGSAWGSLQADPEVLTTQNNRHFRFRMSFLSPNRHGLPL